MPTADITMPTTLRASSSIHIAPAARPRFWWGAAIIATLACAFLHWHVAREATAPRTPWDENGVIQMARLIAGDENVAPMSGSGYYPGWSFLMAPIWWVTQNPSEVYFAAIVLSNVVAVATIVPLGLLGRHLLLSTPQAFTMAAIVMSMPARTVQADYAMSEKLLVFLYAWAVLAAFAVWKRPTWWRMLLFVGAVTAAYLTHARGIALVLTSAVWLVLFLWRRWRTALLGLVLLVGGYFFVDWVSRLITERILLTGFTKSENMAKALSETSPELVLKVLLNQTWAQLVGTAGLFAIGLIVVGVWVWREFRAWRPGPAVFVFGVILSAVAVSVMWWSGASFLLPESDPRFDVWVYTRYIDHIAVFVTLIALAALIRGLSRPAILTALGASVVISLIVVFWIAPTVPIWGSMYGPGNSAAILSWDHFFSSGEPFATPMTPTLTNANRFWILASIFVIVAIASTLVLRYWPRILAVVALLGFGFLSREANPMQSRDYPNDITAAVEEIEAGGELQTVDFDLDCHGPALTHAQALNWLGYWLAPRTLSVVSLEGGEAFDSELVVSCDDWPRAEELGARAVDAGTDYTYRLWVLPGALQSELDREGHLLP